MWEELEHLLFPNERVKISSHYQQRFQGDTRRRGSPDCQILIQKTQCNSSMRVGSFIEGAQHITLAYEMNHFVIEVRAENIDLSHHSCVFDGLQDRNSISCTDIETFNLR